MQYDVVHPVYYENKLLRRVRNKKEINIIFNKIKSVNLIDLLFYTILLIIRRFAIKRVFLSKICCISIIEKIYNSDRDRFSDRSLNDQQI